MPKPWGVWATLGFSCIIAAAYFAIIAVATIALIIVHVQGHRFEPNVLAEKLQTDGFFISIITCVTAPVVVGLCVLFAAIRRGISISEYLGLRMVKWRRILLWSSVTMALAALSDILTIQLGRPVTPDFIVSMYSTARFVPLLWLAIIIAAPVYEEVFFRGFLLKGLQFSRLGTAGAVVITSLAWAAIHTQYDMYGILHIFLFGLFLGWARTKTGSIVLTIIMHSIGNLIATVQVAVYLGSS